MQTQHSQGYRKGSQAGGALSGIQKEWFGSRSAVKAEAGTAASCWAVEQRSASELPGGTTAGFMRKTSPVSRGS